MSRKRRGRGNPAEYDAVTLGLTWKQLDYLQKLVSADCLVLSKAPPCELRAHSFRVKEKLTKIRRTGAIANGQGL